MEVAWELIAEAAGNGAAAGNLAGHNYSCSELSGILRLRLAMDGYTRRR
jgi:hypothetical protein